MAPNLVKTSKVGGKNINTVPPRVSPSPSPFLPPLTHKHTLRSCSVKPKGSQSLQQALFLLQMCLEVSRVETSPVINADIADWHVSRYQLIKTEHEKQSF